MSERADEGPASIDDVRSNPIQTRDDWERYRERAREDPGAFHGSIAKREIHWYHDDEGAWLSWDDEDGAWDGFDAETGTRASRDFPEFSEPWDVAFDDSEAPLYEWFAGGLTNACFNEVDRHVLAGHGDETAFHFEGDRWDQSKNDGRGGPVVSEDVSRRELLVRVAEAAQVLQNLGLETGDRIALNMPNIMEQLYYTEAAKRLGIVYTPVFGGFSDKTLSDRIARLGADVLITSDGGYRNAEIVPYKERYADPALEDYLPVETVTEIVDDTLEELDLRERHAETIRERVARAIEGEATVDRGQAMRGVGNALETFADLSGEALSEIRTEIARALVDSEERLERVVVVEHTGQEIQTHERDDWSADLIADAREDILAQAREAGFDLERYDDLLALEDRDLVRALWASSRPVPVDAEYPLFVIFTSGSTGKPKGVVHDHGGYTAGIANTMKVSFDVVPGEDTIFVVADPGWITGQSYLVSASLTTRTTSILLEGAPVYPDAGRFSSVIERYGATVFKAGVTFLKGIMEDDESVADVREWSTDSLRVATFCAEPVSPAVQAFGMEEVCERYINSYWATEHGGIVWSHFFGNDDFELRADAHTYPLPWVFGNVWVEEEADADGTSEWREADLEERGEIIVEEPYPYLMRYVWGDLEGWDGADWSGEWTGDDERFEDVYWVENEGEYAYLQGDVAKKYADDSFSLHGRSDEVINVSGHRMGTEEIEGAILQDKRINPDSPVANAVVVGADHHEKGLTPVAFVQTKPDDRLTNEVEARLSRLVREEKGVTAVPEAFIEVEAFPETRSGKYMRRMLTAMLNREPIGDTSTLKNPAVVESIRPKCERWRRRQDLAAEQELLEQYRNVTVQYNDVRGAEGERIATVTVDSPPVNALTERALDELNTVLEHLDRREDVGAVVVTGAGPSNFVAGADVEQFLEEVHEFEDAVAFPNTAHEAFRRIEELSVPVVAAINGAALGGGNELQLAAHYSVAERSAEFGQPELNLNLIPGYGGTQRLPRVLGERRGTEGIRDAVTMITNGRTVDAEEALELGLVDELETERTARIRASELAREHMTGADDTLAEARERRLENRSAWAEAGEFPTEVLEDPTVERNRTQCEHASEGRAKAFERAISAIRTGFEEGLDAGLEREATHFAEAVVDPEGGKAGIEKFLERASEPLPTRERFSPSLEEERELRESGRLLPPGEPFYPGVDEIPDYQYAQLVRKDDETGEADHGDPEEAEVEEVVPVEEPGPNEVLVYVLASEVNFNDIWAITGVPVSQFDSHDQDYHVTGSGGVALIVDAGEAVVREGRVSVGDLVTIYSGQSDVLSPRMGLDPMYAGFSIQGYEGPNGSHQQFMLAQGPQVLPIPEEATIEQAGAYVLATGTVWRALFTTLDIEPETSMFVEGASTGTGWETTKLAARNDVDVTGLCSSAERAARIEGLGADAIDRTADPYDDIWGRIPREEDAWDDWKEAGREFVEAYEAHHDGQRADYAVSHAGELSFPRSFQLLEEGGKLAFYGASTGYYLTFLGKPGASTPDAMFERADVRAGDGVLLYYGTDTGPDGVVDETGLRAIEDAREAGARIAVVAYTDEQAEFVESLGFGDAVEGTVSLEGLQRREDDFRWPETLPDLPDAQADPEAFRAVVQSITDEVFKPLGKAVGDLLGTPKNPRGYPDVVFERAGHDALYVSTMLAKPHTGRVVYSEDLEDRRYSMYAPQVWMRQREVLMPTAEILGTHLSNAYEVEQLNEAVDAGEIDLTDPEVVDWDDLPEAHQAMWDNEHEASSYVLEHALPDEGLASKEELFLAWADRGN
ncbi:AMP-binding protein [Natronococcus sp. JC468]|uniref:AMP-binding protein n=1 Tax=Natronococcus sp. JC468 TaxID=1961921 RepID=UPI00143B7269|nr:AMP-binding protein [Natronococcus sp. JC468]NKE36590.1 AMP-binding protein [Natronococcus sp. JC468]